MELDPDNWILKEVVAVGVQSTGKVPQFLRLYPAYPNPFNPVTTIRYELPEAVLINVGIYDLLGREVVRLVDGEMEPGQHQVEWNGRNKWGEPIPSGIYVVRLATPESSKSTKMILLK